MSAGHLGESGVSGRVRLWFGSRDGLEALATKEDLREFRQEMKEDLGSAVNMLMGEIGRLRAWREETSGQRAFLVRKAEGLE